MDTEVCAAVGGQSVCPCTRLGVSGGRPSGGPGRGRRGRAGGTSGSTGCGRWAAGSGRAGAASHRSRRAGGPARSLGGSFGAEAWPPSLPVLAAAILGSAMLPTPILPPLPVTALSCCPGPCWLQRTSRGSRTAAVGPGPGRGPGYRGGHEAADSFSTQAAGSSSQLHSCRCVSASPVISGKLRTSGGGLVPSFVDTPSTGRRMWLCHQLPRRGDLTPWSFPDCQMSGPTDHQNILGAPGAQRPRHPLAGSSLELGARGSAT